MSDYTPAIPPQKEEDLLPYLNEEFVRVAQAFNNLSAGLWDVNYNMPSRVRPGLIKYFDGSNANPLGSGREGLYFYGLDGGWHYCGIDGSGGGYVSSVNGQTGDVTLDATDVGADPSGTASSTMATHVVATDPHTQYALESSLTPVATSGSFADLTSVPTLVRSVVAGTNITVNNSDPLNPVISSTASGGEANTASNLGTGQGVFESKSGIDLRFKSLKVGTDLTIASTANDITITGNVAKRLPVYTSDGTAYNISVSTNNTVPVVMSDGSNKTITVTL